ncbi:MAG: AsmA-like C-terminal region-containing protein [Chitinispirillales bacterium]|jgi:hypothetical protein|nr:AsmA-like C-terminal region-containing protein [Chitinispirillales bacterium]
MNKTYKLEKIFTLALFLVSLLILAGFMPIGFGALTGVAESALREAGADSVSVGGVSVALWTGVRVKNLEAYKRISANEDYRVYAPRVDISCNLLRMGIAAIASGDLFTPGRDMFREVYEKPLELLGDLSSQMMSLRPFRKVTLHGAGISFTNKSGPWISAGGMSASVSSKGKSLDGKVNVTEASVPSLAKIKNFSIRLQAENGRLDLAQGSGSVFGGKFYAELSLDLNNLQILSGSTTIKGLDLDKFTVGTGFSPGSVSGKLNLEAQVEPGPADFDSIRAKGSAVVTELTAVEIALQRTPAVSQVSRDLRTLLFSEVKSDFHLAGGRVNFDEITGTGEVMSFRSTGWIDFEGRMRQNLVGEFSENFTKRLPRLIRNSLEPTEEGGGRFKCGISGTFHRPRVEIDRSMYDRAVGGFFRDLFK